MSEIYYSTDEEIYNYDDIREAAEDIFSYADSKAGDEGIIYQGESKSFQASDFVRTNILEEMQESAYAELGEHAEDYLNDVNKDQEKELQDEIESVVNLWASKHKLHPSFYGIKNVKEIKIRMLDDETDFFEVIEPPKDN